MKIGKFFRVVSALFAFVLTLVLLAISLLTILHLFDVNFIESTILDTFYAGVKSATAELKFLDSLGSFAPLVFTLIAFLLPALLLLFSGIIMLTRQRRSKAKQQSSKAKQPSKAKYVFAAILGILGMGVFASVMEIYTENMFAKDTVLTVRLIVGGLTAFMCVLYVLSLSGKKKKPAAKAKAKAAEPVAETAPTAQEEQVVETTAEPLAQTVEPINTVEPTPAAEQTQNANPAPNAEPAPTVATATVEPTPTVEPFTPEPRQEPPRRIVPEPLWDTPFTTPVAMRSDPQEYIPDERKRTVSDIVENTYRKRTDTLSDANVKKLRTLRSLLDSGTITKDEYIALVDRYLQESK